MPQLADIGVTGLSVMGGNLARNLARHGYRTAVHNRTYARTEQLVADHGSEGAFIPAKTAAEFVASLQRPRKLIVMVKAGAPTDAVIQEMAAYLAPGDILIDAGNAHYRDTIRREETLRAAGIEFVGCGVSGGEEGALLGPSMMPGGSAAAYDEIGPILETIAAQVDSSPCCTHVGVGGAGHFVKMVHNGIEYADMQLIAEAYDLLRRGLGLSAADVGEIFADWNTGDLDSYLIGVTADVLGHTDVATGGPLVDVIVDAAGMKGTGTWTAQAALDLGVPVDGIAAAVFARALSSSPAIRAAGADLVGPAPELAVDLQDFVTDIHQALYASKIVAYAQGLDLIGRAAADNGWEIDLGALARIWRGGCIIRAAFLDRIAQAYAGPDAPATLLTAPYFSDVLASAQDSWRYVVAQAIFAGIGVPGFSSALAYYDQLRAARLPAALIQAQRDYFGAHTYLRTDRDGSFHTRWSGDRSEVSA